MATNTEAVDSKAFSLVNHSGSKNNKGSDYRFQYRQIGRGLMVCEQQYFWIGIPWILPSKLYSKKHCKTELARRQKKQTYEDFIKVQFVGIKTKVLHSYDSDLRSVATDKESFGVLHLQDHRFLDRYSPALLVLMLGVFLIAPLVYLLTFNLIVSICFAILLSAPIAAIIAKRCMEQHRRMSLSIVINLELLRRSGRGSNTMTAIPLFSAHEPIG